jgi:hypothetical protein
MMTDAVDQENPGSVIPVDVQQQCDRKEDLSDVCRLCLKHCHPGEVTEIFHSISATWKTTIASVTNIEVCFFKLV